MRYINDHFISVLTFYGYRLTVLHEFLLICKIYNNLQNITQTEQFATLRKKNNSKPDLILPNKIPWKNSTSPTLTISQIRIAQKRNYEQGQ